MPVGELFPRLMLAHAIGDFALQTNWVFQYKVSRPWGVVLHVAIVAACTFLLLTPYLHDGRVVGLTFVAMIIHLIQDKIKIEQQRDESRNTMGTFLTDQFLHFFFLWWLSLIVAFWDVEMRWPVAVSPVLDAWYRNDRLMWIGTWYFLGTYGGHILLGYLRKTFDKSHEFVLDSRGRKYAGFLERVGIATGVWGGLAWHPGWLLLAAAAMASSGVGGLRGEMKLQDWGFNTALGVAIGVLIYLA